MAPSAGASCSASFFFFATDSNDLSIVLHLSFFWYFFAIFPRNKKREKKAALNGVKKFIDVD